MDEVAYFMDWDLEAVVRGCSSIEAAAPTTNAMEDPFLDDDYFFSHNNNNNNFNLFSEDDEMFFSSFPEFSESTRVLDELEELYKPFYPPVLHNTTNTTTLSPDLHHHHQAMVTNPQAIIIPKEEDVKLKPPSQKPAPQLPSLSKSKRSKKKQNKRVVKEVGAGEIGGCDAWAWRKYGQKPIKGSPYPRSYYRCSSSKGCLARKQVERSHSDPSLFFVTYTSDHNHPHPTRRNSLAGSTRKTNSISILAPPPPPTITANILKTSSSASNSISSNSASSALSLSPRTPLVVQSMEDNNTTNNNDICDCHHAPQVVASSSNIIIINDKGLKKNSKQAEEEDLVELLDGADDDWFPNTQNIDDEMMGLDYRQLEIQIDGGHFMEHHFAAT